MKLFGNTGNSKWSGGNAKAFSTDTELPSDEELFLLTDTPEEQESNAVDAQDPVREIEAEQFKSELDKELNLIIEERREDLTLDQPASITGKQRMPAEPPREDRASGTAEEEEPVGMGGHGVGLIMLTVSLIVLGFVIYTVASRLLA